MYAICTYSQKTVLGWWFTLDKIDLTCLHRKMAGSQSSVFGLNCHEASHPN